MSVDDKESSIKKHPSNSSECSLRLVSLIIAHKGDSPSFDSLEAHSLESHSPRICWKRIAIFGCGFSGRLEQVRQSSMIVENRELFPWTPPNPRVPIVLRSHKALPLRLAFILHIGLHSDVLSDSGNLPGISLGDASELVLLPGFRPTVLSGLGCGHGYSSPGSSSYSPSHSQSSRST